MLALSPAVSVQVLPAAHSELHEPGQVPVQLFPFTQENEHPAVAVPHP